MDKKKFRIIFMGTPDFAVVSLKKLIENQFNIVAVITSPDKHAGRGLKIRYSAVKKFAIEHNLKILQPTNLKSETFIKELKALQPDLQIVVAFRMLPESVWSLPQKGTFNLHASLLPQYRGAAPINWVLINGEKETGVTTFFIDKEIDTGRILLQKKVELSQDTTAGELHDLLANIGADLVIETVEKIMTGQIEPVPQEKLITDKLKPAPKISKNDCKINWNQTAYAVHNLVRGLSPYPVAWTYLSDNNKKTYCKIYKTSVCSDTIDGQPGTIKSDNYSFIKVKTADNSCIEILEIQKEGKKRLTVKDFLQGFDISGYKFTD